MASTDDVWAKTLGKLKVADIKSELTKRDLDIKGVKSVLIERLKTVFEEEGVDPEKYVFTSDEKQMKSSRRSGDVVDLEEEAGDPLDDHEESVSEQHVDTENGIGEELPDNGKRTLDQTENDSLNINLDDDDANLFKDQDFANVDSKGDPKSPPLPDSVPVLQPFTVHDTLRLADASRGQQPSDDLSMVVNVDALSERADDLDSTVNGADGHSPNDANGGGEQPASADPAATVASGGEKTGSDGKKDEAGQTGDSASKESKTTKSTKDKDADKANRNLWVSGLSSKTRATDLTSTFSKFGKVIGAKIVTNARTPGARCYGYITMATADDADKCIVSLHKTELHGHMIKVERSRDSGPPTRRAPGEKSERKPARRRSSPNANKDKSAAQKGSESVKDSVKSSDGTEKKDSVGENKGTSAAKNRGDDRFRGRGGFRQRGVLTFQQIKEERERQRLREQERHLRELQRRRNDEIMRAREQDRRNKHEAFKLERERDRLRVERERIEREKVELMQLERDRQRLEREKLEREREELRRAAIRIHDAKRSVKRPSDDHHYPERKRSTMMAPPPPTISSRHVASASVAGAVGSTRYDERRYGGSSRGATTSSRQDYSRSEDRRVSERYEPSRRDEYRREERSTDYRRDSYETAKASSRHHSDRAVGNWHSGISAPRGTVSNGQRQQDWTSSSALDSGQWSRSGGTGQSSRWGSGGGSSSVRQSGLSAVSSIPGFVGGSSSGAMSGMMGSSVFSMSQDASRFDSYRRY